MNARATHVKMEQVVQIFKATTSVIAQPDMKEQTVNLVKLYFAYHFCAYNTYFFVYMQLIFAINFYALDTDIGTLPEHFEPVGAEHGDTVGPTSDDGNKFIPITGIDGILFYGTFYNTLYVSTNDSWCHLKNILKHDIILFVVILYGKKYFQEKQSRSMAFCGESSKFL